MSAASLNKKNDDTRLGEHSAVQPISGRTRVDETFAVHGLGRGGYVREEKTEKPAA
jgi:hypothetical protein